MSESLRVSEAQEKKRLIESIVEQMTKLSPERQAMVVALIKKLNQIESRGIAIPEEVWASLSEGLEQED